MAKIFKETGESESHWISISDMMSGLMMIFLFIAVSYMINIVEEKNKIQQIAVTYNRLQNDLYTDLETEFKNDLKKWDAKIDRQSLSVRFESPDVLFQPGSAAISDTFKTILNDFFPRYIKILGDKKYRGDIEEIRIEGHTSSEWSSNVPEDDAYFNNMALSQDRTRSVLEYVYLLNSVINEKLWLKKNLTANGLSSSKLIVNDNGEEKVKSRRVEFRVKTNSEKRIIKIVNESK